ncbi:MAG: type II secretion system secretin GspD [Alphaproteobacteria bacterium]|nr:type II secretion system secretin GspD [Alphaproteobacteria bacterium]
MTRPRTSTPPLTTLLGGMLLPLSLLLATPVAHGGAAWAQDPGTPVLTPKPVPGVKPGTPLPKVNPVSGDSIDDGEVLERPEGPGPSSTSGSGAESADRSTARPTQDEEDEEEEDVGEEEEAPKGKPKPPILAGSRTQVTIDFVDTPITDLVKYFAEITGRNFLLTEELKGNVTIISHKPVSVGEAYEAFLSALESAGYTTVAVGGLTKVVGTGEAGNSPLREYYDGNIPYTDNYVTQIIQMENVSVGDISSVVKELAGKSAKVIAYSPTNTLIITDSAVNIRRVYRIISQLDVAAPKSGLHIIPIQYATASEVQKIIEEVYGAAGSSDSSSSSGTNPSTARERLNRRRNQRANATPEPAAEASSTTVGKEGSFIQKIITDERTNSIIVLANDEAITKIRELIAQIDINVDPSSRAAIHVVYLEHAKAEEISSVLSNLAEANSSNSSRGNTNSRTNSRSRLPQPGGRDAPAEDDSPAANAVAALDEGVRITSDENTNSLVIIATPDQFQIIKAVIDKLDIRRKQVFVQAVILEMASEDTFELGLGVHAGIPGANDDGSFSVGSAQLGGSSLGLSSDALSGLAMGVYGKTITVPFGSETLDLPAFGIALNALASNSAVNIVATPEILTMANEEAKIVVGRNVPFPVSTGRDNNNNPIVSYQREDVATTLKVTPQINESDFVTLELFQEVTEVEEDDSGLDVTTAGFITSKRSAETTVLVKDNQTVVIGGLIGSTDTEVESKLPILGDLPLIGNLFRGKRNVSRKTNLLIFLTPHIIEEPADLEEVYRIKWAQREEFVRRFYGKSKDDQQEELQKLLRYSMNRMDEASPWRTKPPKTTEDYVIGAEGGTLTDDSEAAGVIIGPGGSTVPVGPEGHSVDLTRPDETDRSFTEGTGGTVIESDSSDSSGDSSDDTSTEDN